MRPTPRLIRSALLAATGSLALAPCSLADGFSYAFIFGLPTEVTTSGSTTHTGTVNLTTGGGQAGSMFADDKVNVRGGFVSSFRFRIEPGPLDITGDGFAFVIHNDPAGALALGSGGSGLGYDGIASSVAVEFDTFEFSGEFATPHVSVQTRGTDPNTADDSASVNVAYLSGGPVDILDGANHVARIQYEPPVDPEPGLLSVFIDEHFIMSVPMDLTAIGPTGSTVDLTDEDGKMYVGFTAGSGLADSLHILEDWSFDGNIGDCAGPYAFLGYAGHGGPGSTYLAGNRFGGSGPMTFEWYFEGELLSDDDHISGTSTSELHINDIGAIDEGHYECFATNGCASAVSGGVFDLVVYPACNLADITEVGGTAEFPGNPDNQLTVDDIIVFINLFSDGTGCPGVGPCSRADVCGVGGPPEVPEGELTVDDVIGFFNAFSDGC